MGGSWVRLATWRKASPERALALRYDASGWTLILSDGGATIFEGSGETFEGITHMAVTALGKNL